MISYVFSTNNDTLTPTRDNIYSVDTVDVAKNINFLN